MIKRHQSQYFNTERECLLSCYNIYRWTSYRLIPITVDRGKPTQHTITVPLVSLHMEDYEDTNDLDNHCIKGPSFPVPEDWISGRGSILKSRDMAPMQLNNNFKELCASYGRNKGKEYPLDWINANFIDLSEELVTNGEELDGPAFRKLEIAQAEARKKKKEAK